MRPTSLCRRRLRRLCRRAGRFRRHALPGCAAAAASSLVPCGHCLRAAPAFARLHAAYGYDYPLDGPTGACKYGRQPALQGALASLLRQQLQSTHERPEIDLVAAVPLAPARLAERGLTCRMPWRRQSLLQSAAASPTTCVCANATLRRRLRSTAASDCAMRDAFCVKRRCDGLSIAIVDDVSTTGATLDALAKALQKSGQNGSKLAFCQASDHKI